MRRREAIGLALGGGLAAGGAGCRKENAMTTRAHASAPAVAAPALPKREGEEFPLVNVDAAREIRTIAGLRPYRPSGFVVRREDVSGKALIHNYGHGGGGFSLSWGSAHLAVELAGDVAGKEVAVIGAGVMGLSAGRLLQLRGARVRVYARDLPPDTVSNVAGAQWWPFSVFDPGRRTEAFSAQYVAAAEFSYRYFQQFTGAEWGVRWVPNYYLSDGPPANGWISGPGGVLHGLQVDFRDFAPGEHVFGDGHARRFYTMLIEPPVYMSRLLREFQAAGGEVIVRPFAGAGEALALPEPVIFNCAGLGAGGLFGDREIMPIKGQLTFLLPQPEVNYNLLTGNLYMFPRADGILLGGTYEYGNHDTTPDPAAKARILAEHRAVFEKMAALQRPRSGMRG